MSNKYAVLVTMEHAAPADRGKMTKALHLVRDLRAAGKEVAFIFGGKAVEWLPQFVAEDRDSGHPFIKAYGPIFDESRESVSCCNFCCIRFDTRDVVEAAGVPIHGEGRDHMNLADFVLSGHQLITF